MDCKTGRGPGVNVSDKTGGSGRGQQSVGERLASIGERSGKYRRKVGKVSAKGRQGPANFQRSNRY